MTTETNTPRRQRPELFLANGSPRWIRCYDNGGETTDRYTVVYTGRYTHKTGGMHWDVCMNGAPFHPQGIGMHGENRGPIDRPSYGHLGKRIAFPDLPADCQRLVLSDYCDLWDAMRPIPEREAPLAAPAAEISDQQAAVLERWLVAQDAMGGWLAGHFLGRASPRTTGGQGAATRQRFARLDHETAEAVPALAGYRGDAVQRFLAERGKVISR